MENLKALILVGGFGTRLRPLTLTRPKPLIEFGNAPILYHQLEALKKAGVKKVVLATSHQSELIKASIDAFEPKLNIEVIFSEEERPLGTAGPLALSRDVLDDGSNDPFIVMNSDIICSFPLRELLQAHQASNSEATILTTKVQDPSRFGVVCSDETGRVKCFIEKSRKNVGNDINAGIYVLSPRVLDMIHGEMSIERQVFPILAQRGVLTSFPLKGFWADVGEPAGFITGTALYLDYLKTKGELSEKSPVDSGEINGNVLIHPTSLIGPRCKIGPNAVIGHSVTIGEGVRIANSTIMSNSVIKDNAHIESSIIGSSCVVGRWARISNESVLGENVYVLEESHTNTVFVLPNGAIGGCLNVISSATGPMVV